MAVPLAPCRVASVPVEVQVDVVEDAAASTAAVVDPAAANGNSANGIVGVGRKPTVQLLLSA